VVYIRYNQDKQWRLVKNEDSFWGNVGVHAPLLVDTEAEYNWLYAWQLMIGKQFHIMQRGVHGNPTDLPPTLVKIDIPL
jgi:hypothetical protein